MDVYAFKWPLRSLFAISGKPGRLGEVLNPGGLSARSKLC